MAESLLRKIISSSKTDDEIVVFAATKASAKLGPKSNTRSDFIGVSRNSDRWQSFITIKKRKTYIASFNTEKEAAVAFDLHLILLHGFKAKTNFR